MSSWSVPSGTFHSSVVEVVDVSDRCVRTELLLYMMSEVFASRSWLTGGKSDAHAILVIAAAPARHMLLQQDCLWCPSATGLLREALLSGADSLVRGHHSLLQVHCLTRTELLVTARKWRRRSRCRTDRQTDRHACRQHDCRHAMLPPQLE